MVFIPRRFGEFDFSTSEIRTPIAFPLVVAAVFLFFVLIGAVGFLAERTYPMGDEAARAVLRAEPD